MTDYLLMLENNKENRKIIKNLKYLNLSMLSRKEKFWAVGAGNLDIIAYISYLFDIGALLR